jgi:hypothetical protein
VTVALTLPGIEPVVWEMRTGYDPAAISLANRHYSRRDPNASQIGGIGRRLVLVTPCERAVWITRWPLVEMAYDKLDAWRCAMFRNEGAGLSSDLIRAAMELTASVWDERPADGWITWVDTAKTPGPNHGYCFKQAGWWLDRGWSRRRLIRLRAAVEEPEAT